MGAVLHNARATAETIFQLLQTVHDPELDSALLLTGVITH